MNSNQAMKMIKARRCMLFVPGSRPDRFDKALAVQPDMVCIDLEDAVVPSEKNSAREATLNYIGALDSSCQTEIIVRMNGLDTTDGKKDLQALSEMKRPPALVMLPKTSCADDIKLLEKNLASKGVEFIALIETALGLHNAEDIALTSHSLVALMLGGADLSAEFGTEMTWESLLYARGKLVAAAALAQLDVIDVPYLDVKNISGLQQEACHVRAMGFSSKAAIHPAQVEAIQDVFSPTEEQIVLAQRIVSAYRDAGGGAFLLDGKMIDGPVVLSMEKILARAQDR